MTQTELEALAKEIEALLFSARWYLNDDQSRSADVKIYDALNKLNSLQHGLSKPSAALPSEEQSYADFKRHCQENPVKVDFKNLASNRWASEEGKVWRASRNMLRAREKAMSAPKEQE